jgi:alcohol dehydrogenase class IV
MQFEFATAARIVFGAGSVRQLPKLARELGKRALLISGKSGAQQIAPILADFQKEGIQYLHFSVQGEPTTDMVRHGASVAREQKCDMVIGVGGGSAIDAAKAIAALGPNSGEPLDYLEVIGKGQALSCAPLPCIAVPTTAGTGAEVTRNAVIGSPEHSVKASLRSPLMLPKVALVDPELTLNVPPEITATTGLDTLTQLLESFVSIRANAFTDTFCMRGLKLVSTSLVEAFDNGNNRDAREPMAFASLLSGLALANAGLGVVHGFAAPLGGILNAPHGALCAALLPHGVFANIQVMRKRAQNPEALRKYFEAARILTANPDAQPEDLAAWLRELLERLNISPLRQHGLTQEQLPSVVEKAAQANSMKANPIQLTPEELTDVLQHAL